MMELEEDTTSLVTYKGEIHQVKYSPQGDIMVFSPSSKRWERVPKLLGTWRKIPLSITTTPQGWIEEHETKYIFKPFPTSIDKRLYPPEVVEAWIKFHKGETL